MKTVWITRMGRTPFKGNVVSEKKTSYLINAYRDKVSIYEKRCCYEKLSDAVIAAQTWHLAQLDKLDLFYAMNAEEKDK